MNQSQAAEQISQALQQLNTSNTDNITGALMRGLEKYSIATEGVSETRLAEIIHDLMEKLRARLMSI